MKASRGGRGVDGHKRETKEIGCHGQVSWVFEVCTRIYAFPLNLHIKSPLFSLSGRYVKSPLARRLDGIAMGRRNYACLAAVLTV